MPYAAGVAPYLPLLPLITDRHVDALTLARTIDVEITGRDLREGSAAGPDGARTWR